MRVTLNPGGVIGFRLRSSENVWTPQLRRRNASIYAALRLAFADVEVLPGSTNTVLASLAPMARDPALLAERYRQRQIKSRLVSPAYIRYLYENDRFRQVAGMLANENASPNTDSRPVCYQYTVMLWLSKFIPSLGFLDVSALASPEKVIRSPWSLLGSHFRWFLPWLEDGPSLRRALLSASAGFLGMVIETLLMLQYQVKSGVLFQNIGILLMSFMAGLALGGFFADRVAVRRQGPARGWGAGFLVGFAAIGFYVSLGARLGIAAGLWATGSLLLLAGFLVAGVFAYASICEVQDQRLVIAPLYSADLVGGCLGSLAATLVMIPFAGMTATGVAIVAVAIISGLLL